MAGLDLGAQRTGLEARLETVTGLHVYRTVPGDILAPAAVVTPADEFLDYHLAHQKGLASATWRVIVATSKVMDAAGQDLLDAYLSAGSGHTRSLIDAIEGDKTLGGVVDSTHVSVGRSYGEVKWNETASYFGAELMVTCWANRRLT